MSTAREIGPDDFAILAFTIGGTPGRTGLQNIPVDNFIHLEEPGMPDEDLFRNGRDTFQKQLGRQLDLHMEERQADLFASLIAQFALKCIANNVFLCIVVINHTVWQTCR